MNELNAQQKLEQAIAKETQDVINATNSDTQRLEGFAKQIIQDKSIGVTQRLTHLRRCVKLLGKSSLYVKDEDLKNILYEQRRVLNGSNKAWKGGDVLKFNPQPFMWHGVIMKNTTNLVVSLPKVGKSRLFTQMYGQLVECEETFLGQKLQEEIPYFYISGCDQPDDDWALCLKLAGLLEVGTDKLHPNILQLHTKNKNPLHLDEKGINQIADHCGDYPGNLLLLIDSYHSHVSPLGLEESNSNYAEPLLDLQEAVAPYKPTIIVIHHSNRNAAGQGASMSSRGTTALPAAVSQTISMAKLQKDSPLAPTDDRVKLMTEGRASKPLDLLIEQINEGREWISHGDAKKVAKQEAIEEIIEALTPRQKLAIEDIATHYQATGCGMDTDSLVAAIGLDGQNASQRAREIFNSLKSHHLVERCEQKRAKGDGGGKPRNLYRPTKEAIHLYGKLPSNASIPSIDF